MGCAKDHTLFGTSFTKTIAPFEFMTYKTYDIYQRTAINPDSVGVHMKVTCWNE